MTVSRIFAGAIASALLSIGALAAIVAPAQASPATTACWTAIGVCDNRLCTNAPAFASGAWWLQFAGGKDDTAYWDAYYYAGDKWLLYGERGFTCT
jgi:hypothetical protein